MILNSVYFFYKDESTRRFLVIRIEGEKKDVSESLVGVILGERIPESCSGPFKIMRVEYLSSGHQRSHSHIGEVRLPIDKYWEDFLKNKDSLCYIVVSCGKVMSPKKISIPSDLLDW